MLLRSLNQFSSRYDDQGARDTQLEVSKHVASVDEGAWHEQHVWLAVTLDNCKVRLPAVHLPLDRLNFLVAVVIDGRERHQSISIGLISFLLEPIFFHFQQPVYRDHIPMV